MPAYTTAVTSAAVNVATHFTPNGIPGLGDQVTIANGHTLMVPPGVTWDIGDAAAPTTPAIRTAGTAGTGRLIVNGAVRTHADLLQGNAQWEVVGAGAFVESANTTTALTWTLSDGNFQGNCLLVVTGTGSGANRAQIRNGAGAAGFRFITGADTRRINTSFARFFDLGTASLAALPALSTGLPISVQDTVFESCGSVSFRVATGGGAAANVTMRRISVLSPKNPNDTSVGSLLIDVSVANPTGTRVFEDIMVRTGRFFFITPDSGGNAPTLTRCGGRWLAGSGTRIAANMIDCAWLRDDPTVGNLGGPFGLPSSITRGLYVANCPNGDNLHGINFTSLSGSTTLDGLVFDAVLSGNSDTGDLIFIDRSDAGVQGTIRNVVTTRSGGGSGSYGKLVHLRGSAALNTVPALPLIEHCTYYSAGGEAALIEYGEDTSRPGYPNIVGAIRHNLVIGTAPGLGKVINRAPQTAAQNIKDIVAAANVTDNTVFNIVNGGVNGNGHTTGAGGDGLLWTGTIPTYTERTDTPQFVDETRNAATWYRSLVGGTPGTRSADTALAMDALCSQWGDSPVAGATITAAYTWIRDGYRPQLSALRTNLSANNGGWQGAMEGVGVATLTPDATISNTNWSAVGAATLHAALAAGDTDYITASTIGAVAVVALSDPSPLLTLTDASFTVRARLN